MGSILAETIEAEKIIKLVEPVKNLFGAIFFVSVGMLVDPQILVDYALPILALVLTILIGQAVLGTFGFMLGGESLKSAMRCGFSMAQIGEFSFIIASLGLSLGVISKFLYPVVVAVSVITTFLTPYMIRLATPSYQVMEKHLPNKLITALNHLATNLLHPECGCHSLDVHVRTSLNAQPSARLATPLVRQCHHGRAHRHLHSTLPACHRDEEKPQQRVETTVGGEQHQPHTAPLHHRGEVYDSPGLYLLYLQLPEPVYRCADDQHRYCGGIAHHRFQKNEETKHQDGASVHPQPSLTRHRGTGEGHQTTSLRGTPARPRHPHQRV